jgi:hypothetical protein
MWRGLTLERSEPCANARLMREEPCRTMRRANGLRDYVSATADDLRLWHRPTQLFFPRRVSPEWQEHGTKQLRDRLQPS